MRPVPEGDRHGGSCGSRWKSGIVVEVAPSFATGRAGLSSLKGFSMTMTAGEVAVVRRMLAT
jgi:hypothetical protein